MKKFYFPYKKEPSRVFGEVLRPVVEVYLKTKQGNWFNVSVYVDSGADVSIFPSTVCEILGLNLKKGVKSSVTGVSGEEIKIFIHKVWVKIGGKELQIRIGFAEREDIPYLLGRTDVLDHFDITFEKYRACFIVKEK